MAGAGLSFMVEPLGEVSHTAEYAANAVLLRGVPALLSWTRRLLEAVPAQSGPEHRVAPRDVPLGGLVAGTAVASAGLAPVLLAGGVMYFLTTVLTGLRPEWREMDRVRGRDVPEQRSGEDIRPAGRKPVP